jgi:hypothetical protein
MSKYQQLAHKSSNLSARLVIEHCMTVDMDDGQPLPPYLDHGAVWHVIRRANGHTAWRRIFLLPPAESRA